MTADVDGPSEPSSVLGPPLAGEGNIFKRGLAWGIDMFLLRGAIFNLVLPALGQSGARDPMAEIGSTFVVTGIYFIGLWAWTGQTVGKKLFGLRVVRADGAPLGPGRAALRYATYVAMVLPFFMGFLFSGFFLLFSSGHRGLHDRLAGTLVVRVR